MGASSERSVDLRSDTVTKPTPAMFEREVAKMPAGVKVVAVHIKVRYREQVIRELLELRLPALEIGECEREYCC